MAKSQDAFRTISEVAEWLDTPAHVLRFWESKFSQIKPVKRAGGRRYYRPDDMALLAGIKTLLHDDGLTIKGAQKLLREKGVKHVAALGADPREPAGDVIEGAASHPDDTAPEPETAAPRVEPVQWDPDDPWPADPAPDTAEPAAPGADPAAPEDAADVIPGAALAAGRPPDPGDAAEPDEARDDPQPARPGSPSVSTDAPPEDEKVALPFVRNRAAAKQAQARRSLPAPPPLPDEAAIEAPPGILASLASASRPALRDRRSRIAPLAARLRDIVDRIDAGPR